jgi:GNAT superfamily N-acetyltransferase
MFESLLIGSERTTAQRRHRQPIKRFREVAQIVGPWRALGLAALWCVVQRYEVFCAPVEPRTSPPVPESEYRHSELTADTLRDVVAAKPLLTLSEIEDRLQQGERCGLWWSGDQVVHYRWFATGPVKLPFASLGFRPAVGDFLTLEVFTRPAFRRQGLQSISLAWSHEVAAGMGLRRRIGLVAWWNTPSLTVARRHYRTAGTLTRWTVGPRSIYRGTGEVRVEDGVMSVNSDRE